MTTTDPPELLKTGDVARMLGVSRQHVVDLCDRGEIQCVRVGNHRRVPRSQVDKFKGPGRRLTREQEKSLWLHRALVTPLVTDPDLVISKAKANIVRWKGSHRPDGMTVRYLSAWERVLDSGVDQVIEVVTSSDLESCELRQSSPFAGVLPDEVRMRTLRSFKRHWEKVHEKHSVS